VKPFRLAALIAALTGMLVSLPQTGALARDSASVPRHGPTARPFLIQELNFVFTPDPATIPLGQTVRWGNTTLNDHTTTGDAPLSLWDSGLMDWRETFNQTFTAAGSYGYFCSIHERYNMFSSIRVADAVDPPSGPVGTVFTVTVATVPAPTDFVYDVQKANPNGVWRDWMMGVTSISVTFDSSGWPEGTYRFRSRLHRLSDDASSDYSPNASIAVTP
jgi:plastocyanin